MKEFILNILRGIVIGISNVIPGVSGDGVNGDLRQADFGAYAFCKTV